MNVQLLSGIVFLAVALLHLVRVVMQLPFVIGTWDVPQAMSMLAVAVAGALAYLNFTARRT